MYQTDRIPVLVRRDSFLILGVFFCCTVFSLSRGREVVATSNKHCRHFGNAHSPIEVAYNAEKGKNTFTPSPLTN